MQMLRGMQATFTEHFASFWRVQNQAMSPVKQVWGISMIMESVLQEIWTKHSIGTHSRLKMEAIL